MNERKKFLTETVPQLLQQLSADATPTFGIMTAQHMVEHLVQTSKGTVKGYGPSPDDHSEGQMKFMQFVEKGANFKFMGNKKAPEDLKPPRLPSLQEAIVVVPEAISRLYSFDESHKFYNPMMGTYTFDQMELFHYMHYKHHLENQFGLTI